MPLDTFDSFTHLVVMFVFQVQKVKIIIGIYVHSLFFAKTLAGYVIFTLVKLAAYFCVAIFNLCFITIITNNINALYSCSNFHQRISKAFKSRYFQEQIHIIL